jgi:putative copper export protein
MDTANVQDNPELLEMHLDYDGGNTLREAVRWSKFLSIVGIAGIGLLLVVGLIATPYVLNGYGQLTPESEGIIDVLLITLALYFSALIAAAILLLRFSRLTKKGMDQEDQHIFNRGLKSLKITFIILGILSCLSLLGLLFSLIYPM